MEENKSLVINFGYYIEKEDPEAAEISKKLDSISAQIPNSLEKIDIDEVSKLMLKSFRLSANREVDVCKEYPEFLVKDFKTKEELFDFLDEDEPMLVNRSYFCFKSVPECLKEIGFVGNDNDKDECIEYLEAKHFKV